MWMVVAISVLAELFEAAWQKADTVRGTLANGYRYYNRSIFLFLLMHTGYIWVLYVSLRYDLLNWPILLILTLKSIDIFFKIDLIQRVYGAKSLPADIAAVLDTPVPTWYYLMGAVTYPYFIYAALHV